ncbi:MAG: transporter [Planctomycetes bacterium]|nr:transporter [Planctomycetota bacterium]
MRRHGRISDWLLAILLLGGLASAARAQQGMGMGNMTMPSMGAISTPSGQIFGAGKPGAEAEKPLAVLESFVSFIDPAVPRNVVGIRFDGMYGNRSPMRLEYLFAKGGLPNSVGFRLPETRVDTLDLTSFAEYSIVPWFSVFAEGSFRWINPEINDNQSGNGDMRYGLKVCTWSSDALIATFLVRLYQPSARHETLGTTHWSIEPGILAAYRLNEKILIEGEFRYWAALGGSEFSGDLMRYGVGISYGQRSAGFWYMPVAEGIGWTMLNGKTMYANSATDFTVRDAAGQTIVNAYLGLRVGYGQRLELYGGYGRSFTGDIWARDTYRLEFRFLY